MLKSIRPHIQEAPAEPAPPVEIEIDTAGILDFLQTKPMEWLEAMREAVTSPEFIWQVAVILAAIILSRIFARPSRKAMKGVQEKYPEQPLLARIIEALITIAPMVIMAVILWFMVVVFNTAGLSNGVIRIVATLLNAWIIIRLVTTGMKSTFWARTIALIAWGVAALYILRLLGPVTEALDSVGIKTGGSDFSLLNLINGIGLMIIALWGGTTLGNAIQTQLKSSKQLAPSTAGMLGQIIKVALLTVAVIFGLSSIGVDLTVLALFTGALGVGIGFGLQTVISSFISGIIILFEKSLRVGDYVELASGVTGTVKEINIRSTLIATNDNIDIVVPNEEFIKGQLINWTMRDTLRRRRIPFGVAYGTDKKLVRKAALEAADKVIYSQSFPEPDVWLVGFGDSSLDFELVVWVREAAVKQPNRVDAAFFWALHTALEEHNIEIPFPQRDLHIIPAKPEPETDTEAAPEPTIGVDDFKV